MKRPLVLQITFDISWINRLVFITIVIESLPSYYISLPMMIFHSYEYTTVFTLLSISKNLFFSAINSISDGLVASQKLPAAIFNHGGPWRAVKCAKGPTRLSPPFVRFQKTLTYFNGFEILWKDKKAIGYFIASIIGQWLLIDWHLKNTFVFWFNQQGKTVHSVGV